MNSELNLSRLGLFIKRQLYLNMGSMWIAISAILGIILLISGLVAYSEPEDVPNLINFYLVVFFIGGYIFTSRVFNEMHSPQKSYAFLTLPVSTTERLLGAWVIASPVFVLVSVLGMVILLYLSGMIAGQASVVIEVFDRRFFMAVTSFMVTQTIFFLGACTFRGNNFLKTLLALFIFLAIVISYTGFLGYTLFGNTSGNFAAAEVSGLKDTVEFIGRRVIPVLFWGVFAPFMLVVSFFKLKERQV